MSTIENFLWADNTGLPAPDGCTLLVAASDYALNLAQYTNLPYDTFKACAEITPQAVR